MSLERKVFAIQIPRGVLNTLFHISLVSDFFSTTNCLTSRRLDMGSSTSGKTKKNNRRESESYSNWFSNFVIFFYANSINHRLRRWEREENPIFLMNKLLVFQSAWEKRENCCFRTDYFFLSLEFRISRRFCHALSRALTQSNSTMSHQHWREIIFSAC